MNEMPNISDDHRTVVETCLIQCKYIYALCNCCIVFFGLFINWRKCLLTFRYIMFKIQSLCLTADTQYYLCGRGGIKVLINFLDGVNAPLTRKIKISRS